MLNYRLLGAPEYYSCSTCGAHGCKLWRKHHSLEIGLRCLTCICAEERIFPAPELDPQGHHQGGTDQIGNYLPAVPISKDEYHSYGAVPQEACSWWAKLPNTRETSFTISHEKMVQFEKFLSEHNKTCPITSIQDVSMVSKYMFTFRPSGLGNNAKVVCLCGTEYYADAGDDML